MKINITINSGIVVSTYCGKSSFGINADIEKTMDIMKRTYFDKCKYAEITYRDSKHTDRKICNN